MPYELDGNCVKKKDGETVKCHDSHEEAVAHLQALQANVKDSSVVEMSLRITKASYNKSEEAPMKWAAIDSDTEEDLYEERMSLSLYQDFVRRIEDNEPVPEAFQDVICEPDWCGGMPYLSIAHYKAGSSKRNVPGEPISVFIDGKHLKSKGILYNNDLGRKTFDALCDDLYKKKSDPTHLPVRISIGFLDLEHKHLPDEGGQEFVFTRSKVGEICPLCAQGIGGKIYSKGQLIHLAMTRVPVNPRTEMIAERSMDEITTKKQDAESIVGDLANELEEKSIASDILVVRSDNTPETRDDRDAGSTPTPDPSEIRSCYDPNTGGWDNECISSIMDKYMPSIRKDLGVPVKSETVDGLLDVVVATIYKSFGREKPVVEDAMETKETTPVVEQKAEVKEEDVKKEEKKETEEMSSVEKAFVSLQTAIGSKNVDEVNKAFAALGTSVEKEFKGEPKPVSADDIEAIVKSAVAEAVAPLNVEIAQLKAAQGQVTPAVNGVVQSKALSLNPGGLNIQDIVKRSGAPVPDQPTRKLSQIEKLARRSAGLQS